MSLQLFTHPITHDQTQTGKVHRTPPVTARLSFPAGQTTSSSSSSATAWVSSFGRRKSIDNNTNTSDDNNKIMHGKDEESVMHGQIVVSQDSLLFVISSTGPAPYTRHVPMSPPTSPVGRRLSLQGLFGSSGDKDKHHALDEHPLEFDEEAGEDGVKQLRVKERALSGSKRHEMVHPPATSWPLVIDGKPLTGLEIPLSLLVSSSSSSSDRGSTPAVTLHPSAPSKAPAPFSSSPSASSSYRDRAPASISLFVPEASVAGRKSAVKLDLDFDDVFSGDLEARTLQGVLDHTVETNYEGGVAV